MKTGEATSSFVPARDTCQTAFRRARAHLTGSLEELYSRSHRFLLGDASDASPKRAGPPRLDQPEAGIMRARASR
jgi:hypothetical protein